MQVPPPVGFVFTLYVTPYIPQQPEPAVLNKPTSEPVVTKPASTTAYQQWKENKSSEPFPISRLTSEDIHRIIPKDKTVWRELLLRYQQILNAGRLPHGESSPKKGKLFHHKNETRVIDGLNDFLAGANITPIHLFKSDCLPLR